MLFSLPSQNRIVAMLFSVCIFGGVFSVLPISFSFQHFIFGLSLGISFFLTVLVSDFLLYRLFLRNEVIYSLKRCLALSFFSTFLWFLLSLLGGLLVLFFLDPIIWFKLSLIGFSAAVILRLIVFLATILHGQLKVLIAALLQPVLCLTVFFAGWVLIGEKITVTLFIYAIISLLLAISAALIFVSSINRVGKKSFGLSSFALLKAFLANWAGDVNAPLEEFFESLGREENIEFSIFGFKVSDKIKAVLIVPSFHPGPFKNVGSSPLPHMIQNALSEKMNVRGIVTHGLFGHELDLSSQIQNQKIIDRVLNSIKFDKYSSKISPFIQVKESDATVSCQIFGNHALFMLTVAPKTTEDFPKEIGLAITRLMKKYGLDSVDIVNAHNSLNEPFNIYSALPFLQKAAVLSLEKAKKEKQRNFKIGVAHVLPKEFSIENGMGPGGINVLIIEVGNQKVAYIVIDGNNMAPMLREEILAQIKEEGIDQGEVLTTDTHIVSAIVIGKRGYHPVGETMDKQLLLFYIKKAVCDALNDMAPAQVSYRHEIVEKVKVIGEKQIEKMCLIAEKSVRKAKQLIFTLFPVSAFLLFIFLFVLPI
jgi:putative membrane protein